MGLWTDAKTAVRAAVRKARIGLAGPTTHAVMPPIDSRSTLVTYEAIGADPQRWFSIMQGADQGRTGPMISLFYDARKRDTHLNGTASKRTQSFAGRPVVFEPPEGFKQDKDALETAEMVRRIVMSDLRFVSAEGIHLGYKAAITHLQSAATDGYAVTPMDWRTNARGEIVPVLHWEHGRRFGFCRDTLRIGFYESGNSWTWKVSPLSEYPDRFIAHIPMNGNSDYPWRRGAMGACIIPSFLKREGLRFLLILTERFGMPQPYARVPAAVSDDDNESPSSLAQTTQRALLSLNKHWTATFDERIQIDSIPGSGNVEGKAHAALIDWADTTISIGMLGQNLTTKVEGGSHAAAEAHRYVAGDLHLADATELSETLTQQLCEPIVRFNRPGSPVPIMKITTGYQQPFSREDVEASLATPDEFRRGLGHDAKPDGTGSRFYGELGEADGKPGPKPAPPDHMQVPGLPENDEAA